MEHIDSIVAKGVEGGGRNIWFEGLQSMMRRILPPFDLCTKNMPTVPFGRIVGRNKSDLEESPDESQEHTPVAAQEWAEVGPD